MSSHENNELKEFRRIVKWLLIALVFLLGIVVSIHIFNFYEAGKADQEAFAQFGDYIGGILNPILGFCTVLLLIYSIQIQAKELKNTTEELKLTREEMKIANEEARRSAEAMIKQSTLIEQRERLSETNQLIKHYKTKIDKYLDKEWNLESNSGITRPLGVWPKTSFNQLAESWRKLEDNRKDYYRKYFEYMRFTVAHSEHTDFVEQLVEIYKCLSNEIASLIINGSSFRSCQVEFKWLSDELRKAEDVGLANHGILRSCFSCIEEAQDKRWEVEPNFPKLRREAREVV